MNQEISWKRFSIEAIVIVGSILLAFAIDAWWDTTQSAADEQTLLGFIAEEISVNLDEINQRLIQTGLDQSSFIEFSNKEGPDLSNVHWDDATRYFNSIYRPNTVDISQTAAVGVVNTGSINLIQNLEVRNALENLAFDVARLQRRSEAMLTVENTAQIAVAKHQAFQIWNLENRFDLPYETDVEPIKYESEFLDMRGVRSDSEVMAAANALFTQRRVNSRFIAGLKESLEDLRVMVEQALN